MLTNMQFKIETHLDDVEINPRVNRTEYIELTVRTNKAVHLDRNQIEELDRYLVEIDFKCAVRVNNRRFDRALEQRLNGRAQRPQGASQFVHQVSEQAFTAFLQPMQAINQGYNGRFILFPELVEMLYQSVADHTEAKLIHTFAAYDCLLIDELGYVEIEPIQVGLFFTLMQKRHKTKTTFITSNLGFEQWTSFLKNDQLTAALMDRLTETSHVINMKNCVSLRPKLGPA